MIAPRVACEVIDRAIQVHGGAGVSSDTPLAAMYAGARTLRIADGPDDVHVRSVARSVLKPYRSPDPRRLSRLHASRTCACHEVHSSAPYPR